jgi:hypothetical protein
MYATFRHRLVKRTLRSCRRYPACCNRNAFYVDAAGVGWLSSGLDRGKTLDVWWRIAPTCFGLLGVSASIFHFLPRRGTLPACPASSPRPTTRHVGIDEAPRFGQEIVGRDRGDASSPEATLQPSCFTQRLRSLKHLIKGFTAYFASIVELQEYNARHYAKLATNLELPVAENAPYMDKGKYAGLESLLSTVKENTTQACCEPTLTFIT